MNNLNVVKWDAAKVVLDMEMLTSNGSYVFSNDECLKQEQIKSYFSRLALKQRSMQEDSYQPTKPTPISTSSSVFTNSNNTSNMKFSDMSTVDKFNESEETDDRDLEVYSWRQVLDEARGILNVSSVSFLSTTSSPVTHSASVTNAS